MGKTVQVAAFLNGLFQSELVESILIVMPVSLLANWKKELAFWAPDIPVQVRLQSRQETVLFQPNCS